MVGLAVKGCELQFTKEKQKKKLSLLFSPLEYRDSELVHRRVSPSLAC